MRFKPRLSGSGFMLWTLWTWLRKIWAFTAGTLGLNGFKQIYKCKVHVKWVSLMAQMVKRLPAMPETWVQSLGREDPLEKEMATHSSTLAWKIPWMEEPGRLPSTGSQRVGHDWVTLLTYICKVLSAVSETLYVPMLAFINYCKFLLYPLCFYLHWQDSLIKTLYIIYTSFILYIYPVYPVY